MDEIELFTAALARTDPAERAAFLDLACAGNLEMRRRLDVLLAAHARKVTPLDRPPAELAGIAAVPPAGDPQGPYEPVSPDSLTLPSRTTAPRTPEGLGVIAGRYTLVEVIGKGGMGCVYLARQTEPVKRQVALKLIRAETDSRAVLARFEAERQALALMDHPNIARVYDGGTAPDGRPFFVMELVRGMSLTQFCDLKRLSVAARLELFVSVCQAVQHAHQKGVIHRDLKPGNVLVTEVDGRPTPKVIDFGIAKATEQKLTDHSFADTGLLLGTPTYMSPEQADPTCADIDTRTDVYALGVMLYELLVGSPPIDGRQFKQEAVLEMLRMVREVEPPRPSTRLRTAVDLPNIAARRSIEPAKLTQSLAGELDWVVMKAMEKDRDRRYDSANGLARDIQRYLADEVVEARPPSRGYRLKKFIRRNKGQVVAAGLLLLTLLAGVAGTTWGMFEARRQAGFAESARAAESERADGEAKERRRAEASEKLASDRREQAEAEKRVAEAVRDFLQNKLLRQADLAAQSDALLRSGRGSSAADRDVRVRELLDRAAAELTEAKIEASFPNQPAVQAEILQTVGNTYTGLGVYERAIELLSRAVSLKKKHIGPDAPSTLICMNNLGRAYTEAGQLNLAVPLHEETLTLLRTKLGPDDVETIIGMNNLAMALLAARKWDRALSVAKEALDTAKAKLAPDHHLTLSCRDALAQVHGAMGNLAGSVPLFEENLRLRTATLGPDHPHTLVSKNNLAAAYADAGRWDLAVPEYEQVAKLQKARLGPEHPHTLISQGNLARAYLRSGKVDLALPLYVETHRLFKATLGPDHPNTLTSMDNLVEAYGAARKTDQSLSLAEEALKLKKVKFGPDAPSTLAGMNNLALAYQRAGRAERALALLEEVLELKKAKLGPDDPSTLSGMNNLATMYGLIGRRDEAAALHAEARKRRAARLGRDHPDTVMSTANLAATYENQGKIDLALPLWREAYERRKAQLGPEHPLTVVASAALGRLLVKNQAFAEGEALLRQALAAREKTQPDDWATFNTRSQLGGALLDQKRYDEAGPLLLDGYQGMKRREKAIPAPAATRIPEALDRLIELAAATNNPDEVARWRAERAKYPSEVAPPPRVTK